MNKTVAYISIGVMVAVALAVIAFVLLTAQTEPPAESQVLADNVCLTAVYAAYPDDATNVTRFFMMTPQQGVPNPTEYQIEYDLGRGNLDTAICTATWDGKQWNAELE